jgi:dTDP-glucose 4,6-dehydratase
VNILVTGGSGFIGSHFVEHVLAETDWNVTVLDSLTYAGDMHRIADSNIFDRKRVKFFFHNLQAAITEEKDKKLDRFDYVAHFAAESHVENSLHDPVSFAASNVVGTTHLLNYLRVYQPQIKAIVNVSTDEVYGPAPEGVFYEEWSTIKPSNPYSASKAGQDAMAYAFFNAFGMPIITTRTMNNFGERQHPEKFVSLVMKKVLDGDTVEIHGNGEDIGSRCWLHARNHADGVLFLLKNCEGKFGDMFHIVGDEYTNLEIAEMVAENLGQELKYEIINYHSTRPGHDLRYAMDGQKLRGEGWNPPVGMEDALKKMCEWTVNNPEWL